MHLLFVSLKSSFLVSRLRQLIYLSNLWVYEWQHLAVCDWVSVDIYILLYMIDIDSSWLSHSMRSWWTPIPLCIGEFKKCLLWKPSVIRAQLSNHPWYCVLLSAESNTQFHSINRVLSACDIRIIDSSHANTMYICFLRVVGYVRVCYLCSDYALAL